MFINFKTHEISWETCELARTFMLIIKKNLTFLITTKKDKIIEIQIYFQ